MTWPTDSFDDTGSPWPGPIVQTASAIVEDRRAAILLHRRDDSDVWALPGGTMEPRESIQETAVRTVAEETGFEIRLTGLVGIYTGPGHVVIGDDGEIRQVFNICFAATITSDRAGSDETPRNVTFVTPDQLTRYPMHPTTRQCIDDHLSHNKSSGAEG